MGDEGTGSSASEPVIPAQHVYDIDWRSVVVAVAAVVGVAVLVGATRSAPRTVSALVLALFLALALDPAVDWVQGHLPFGARRGALATVLTSFALVFVAAIVFLVPPTVRQVQELSSDIPRVVGQLGDLPLVGERLERAGVPESIERFVEQLPQQFSFSSIGRVARTVTDALMAAGITVLLTIALLLDGDRIVGLIRRAVPEHRRHDADRVGRLAARAVGRYAVASLLIATATGTVVLITGLVLGVPLAPLAAVWVALWDLVPQVGGAVGGATFIILALAKGGGTALIASIVFLAYLQVRNHLIGPLVAAYAVHLSPLATMIAVLVGVTAAGFLGGLFAVPLTGVAKAAYLEFRGRGVLGAEHDAGASRESPA